jgi:GAF domain-containing protein
VACFWATSLEKYRRRDRADLVPPELAHTRSRLRDILLASKCLILGMGAIPLASSGKGAKSRTHGRKSRSTGTKARVRVGRNRKPRADLEMKLAEALEQQTATSEILRVIRSSPSNVQPVFDAVAESAARLCESFDSAVWRRESDRLLLVAHHGAIPQTGSASFLPLVRGTVGGRSVLDGRTIHIADIQTKGDEFPNTSENARRQGYRTILSVPLMREGAAIGAIVLRRTEARLFSERQIALLQTFADQAVIAIENVRLFEKEQQRTRELSESLEQQTATSEVLQVISTSPGELQPVFEAMLANATRLCEASYGTLWLRDGDGYRAAAIHGDLPTLFVEQWRSGTLYRPDPEVTLARSVRARKPIQEADLRTTLQYLKGDPLPVTAVDIAGIRTLMVVPMLKDNEPIGGIAIYRKEVRPFGEKQIELVTNFAAQAVIAIENTRLLNELRESLQQQTATADVLKVISRSTFDLQKVFDTLVESAARLCRAEKANIARVQGDSLEYLAVYGFEPEYLEYMLSLRLKLHSGSISARAVLEGRTVHIPDVLADPEFTLVEAQRRGNFRTALGVPLLRDGNPIGAMFLTRAEVDPFTQKQIELVETFADQAVIAIENVRLFDEVQARTRELSEALERQTATSEVLQVISSSPGDLQPVFETILANATRICEAKFGSMYLSEGGAVRIVAMHNAPPSFAEERRRNPLIRPSPDTTLGRALATKQTVQIADVQNEPAYTNAPSGFTGAQLAKLAGARTVVVVPMLKESELVGVIIIYRQEVRPFTDKQIELVSNFARQAVIAIENTRLLNELRESLEQQTATSEVLRVISSSPGELKPVFEAMLENATRLCEASYGVLWLKEGDAFRAVALHGAMPPAYTERWADTLFRPSPDVPFARAAATGRPVHVEDLRTSPAYLAGDPLPVAAVHIAGVRTLVAVPMLKGSEAVGVFVIFRTEVQSFTNKQIDLVKSFADQAVIAIENTRLLNELRESLQQQTATADVLKVISRSTFDLQAVLDTLVESAARLRGGHGRDHPAQGRSIAVFCQLWIRPQVPRLYGKSSARVGTRLRRRPRRNGRQDHSNFRRAGRSGLPDDRCCQACGLSHRIGRPPDARGRPDRRDHPAAQGGAAAVYRQADRVGRDLRRPGGDRDRERAAVR